MSVQEKINLLFQDINAYYKNHKVAITQKDLDKWLIDDNSPQIFFKELFEDREFNVKVTLEYITELLSEYNLSIKNINDYKDDLLRIKKKEEEKLRLELLRLKRKKKIALITFILILISGGSYYWYYQNKQEKIRLEIALEEARIKKEKEERDVFLRETLSNYFIAFDQRNVQEVLKFWSLTPSIYKDVSKTTKPDINLREIVKNSIMGEFQDFSSITSEIKSIEKVQQRDDGFYEVELLQKITNEKTRIEYHIEKKLSFLFDEENKLIHERILGPEKTIYISEVSRNFKDGRYVGSLLNDKKHGFGVMYYNNGDIFKGEWVDGLRGKGEYIFSKKEVSITKEPKANIPRNTIKFTSPIKNSTTTKKENNSNSRLERGWNMVGLEPSFYNWAPGEPTGNQKYVFMDSKGNWYDHGNSLNDNGYALIETNKLPYEQILKMYNYNDYDYLGDFNDKSYFLSKEITRGCGNLNQGCWEAAEEFAKVGSKDVIITGGGYKGTLVVINSYEELQFLIDRLDKRKHREKLFWIGMMLMDGEFMWRTPKFSY